MSDAEIFVEETRPQPPANKDKKGRHIENKIAKKPPHSEENTHKDKNEAKRPPHGKQVAEKPPI